MAKRSSRRRTNPQPSPSTQSGSRTAPTNEVESPSPETSMPEAAKPPGQNLSPTTPQGRNRRRNPQISSPEPNSGSGMPAQDKHADANVTTDPLAKQETAKPADEPKSKTAEPVAKEVTRDESEVARLRARITELEVREQELARLRGEYAELSAALKRREVEVSEIAALQAEKQALLEKLNSELSERQNLIRRTEELQWLEQSNQRLLSTVEEMSNAWQPERVTELEMEIAVLQRQIKYLKDRIEEMVTANEDLQRRLAEIDVSEIDDLRKALRESRDECVELSQTLKLHQSQIDDAVAKRTLVGQATGLHSRNLKLTEENAALRIEVNKLQAQTAQIDAIRAGFRQMELENRKLKETIDSINESEERHRERCARAFDALQLVLEEPECNSAVRPSPWPGDRAVINQVVGIAKDNQFIFERYQLQWLLAAIHSARLVILKGFSGLGKTSLPILLARSIGAGYDLVPVQPSWRSKVDLLGFFNHFDQRFLPTRFTKALLRAQQPGFRDRHYFIILDEMNLSRVEYYFSDFVVQLEDTADPYIELFDNASIDVRLPNTGIGQYIQQGNQLRIPPNVTFFGTINDDETTFAISDKIYDRAQVIHFYGSQQAGRGKLPTQSSNALSFSGFKDGAPAERSDSVLEDFLKNINDHLQKEFAVNLAHRARMQMTRFIEAYFGSGGDRSEALDLQIISKIIPKIRYSHKSEYAESLKQLAEWLQVLWPYKGDSPDKTTEVLELMQGQV